MELNQFISIIDNTFHFLRNKTDKEIGNKNHGCHNMETDV